MQCEMMVDLFAGFAAGTLDEETRSRAATHLENCEDCRAEMEIVSLLARAEPVRAPSDLEERVRLAARQAMQDHVAPSERDVIPLRPRRTVPAWALSAAAVLVLAIGTPLLVDQMTSGGAGDVVSADGFDDPVATVWTTEDGLIAGAPALDMLTDDELRQLLEELDG